MASTAPPIVASHPLVNPAYDLKELPEVPGARPDRVVLDAFRLGAAKLVSEAWDVDVAKVFASVDTSKKGADLSVAIPRFFKKDQADWGKKVVDKFEPSALFVKVELVGVFINFHFNKASFTYHTLRTINLASRAAEQNPTSHSEAYGTNPTEGNGKHMLIDFSSPNIAKPFHAGHLRSTIIGAVVANLYEAMGWKVTRLNYLGDWGTQYGLLSIGFDRFGNEEKLLENPIRHLFDVYVAINEEKAKEKARIDAGEKLDLTQTVHGQAQRVFKAMEDGDATALAQWSRFRDLSIVKLKEVYEKLNINFDVFWGESQVSTESMDRAIRVVQEKNLTCEDRGALLVDLTKFKMDRAIVRKGDGTTIYLTRDLGGAYDKYQKYKFDKHIYVVQSAQTLHFNQLFKTLELMDEEFAKPGMLEHINFGMVNGMSTRRGTVKFLDDIIDEATDVMHEQMRSNEAKYAQVEEPEKTSAVIGASAVKIQDMSAKRINDYNFDIKRCTSFEGDFGPFIQYSYVRLCSVQRKNPNVIVPTSVDEIDLSVLDEAKVHEIINHLAAYPDAITTAYTKREPSTLVTWCFRMGHLVGSAWETVKVTHASEEEARARLFLYVSIREVLGHAMKLLSLSLIERM